MMFILEKGYKMTLKIKLKCIDGIEIVGFELLPHNIKDAIVKILDYGKYTLFNNTILVKWDEEVVDVLYMLNEHFDLLIMRG